MHDPVHLPPYGNPLVGYMAAFVGLVLLLVGQRYRIVVIPRPLPLGLCLLAFGSAMVFRSPSALWLLCPALAVACAAYVLAHPRGDERWLPVPDKSWPTPDDVFKAVVYGIVPWLLLYHVTSIIGVPQGTFRTSLPFEDHMRVWEWSIFLYETAFPAVIIVPFIARTRYDLRRFCLGTLVGSAIAYPLYWTLPGLAPRRAFHPETLLGQLLEYERGTLPPVAAFPSFHVIWSIVCAELFAATWPRYQWLWRAWAGAVAISCVTTSMHTIADVAAGLAVGLIAIRFKPVSAQGAMVLWYIFALLLTGRLVYIGAPAALTASVLALLVAAHLYVMRKRRIIAFLG